jgi:hypothetical protein
MFVTYDHVKHLDNVNIINLFKGFKWWRVSANMSLVSN